MLKLTLSGFQKIHKRLLERKSADIVAAKLYDKKKIKIGLKNESY